MPNQPAMTATSERDILIIGGGIFGAAIAFALGQRGLGERVLLLERRQLAHAATSRAAALVTLVRDKEHFIPLVQETYRAIETLRADFAEDVGMHRVGALHVAKDSAGKTLRQLAERCAEHDITHETLSPANAVDRAPWLDASAFDTAIFFPQEAYVEPYLLCTAYARAAFRMGVKQRLDADVRHIRVEAQRITGVELADGSILPARIVINAAGAWAGMLCAELGVPLTMAPVRLAVSTISAADWSISL